LNNEFLTGIPTRKHKTLQLTEIFRDDFNDQSVDLNKWTVYEFNSPIGIDYSTSDDVYQEDGHLFIKSQKREYGGRNFTSGYVDTYEKFSFLYGEVEWRAKLPVERGLTSALGIFVNKGAEICLFTRRDQKDLVQPKLFFPSQVPNSGYSRDMYRADDGFHTFKVIWEHDRIVWSVDGRQIWNITESWKILHKEMYLLMYGNIGNSWAGVPDMITKFPTWMVIDYVTVHQWK
jgi:beta-glucanase (GH16 family)